MPSVRTCFILCLEKDYGLVEVLKNQPAFAYWVDHGSPKGKGFSTHKVRTSYFNVRTETIQDSYVTVQDVTVTFSNQRIAEFLGLPRPEGPAILELEDLAPLQLFDLFRLCTKSEENVPEAPHIVHKTLNDFFRMLHLIMAYNIDPRKCTTESTFERARLMGHSDVVPLMEAVRTRVYRFEPVCKTCKKSRQPRVFNLCQPLGAVVFSLRSGVIWERGEVKRKRGEVERDEIRRFVALDAWKSIGTKSFARKRHELLGAVHIDEVGPADLYVASHKCKNGEWICDAARMNFEKMMKVEAQATMEGRTLTNVEVFTQVLRGETRTQLELEQIRVDREKESQEQMHEIHSLQQKMEEMQERMTRYDRFMSRFSSGAFDDVDV
ncbi:hypothetical protein CJ030_MR4G022370 [Morella rubra]|uniref:Uncharacterized protein n=1 Tax=Morella rubra TaxID=262757 RepID=A0A6A1VRB9_9ROSI|nr:hypothetical protein CJ030_MR4G022370 [Morella rubra]